MSTDTVLPTVRRTTRLKNKPRKILIPKSANQDKVYQISVDDSMAPKTLKTGKAQGKICLPVVKRNLVICPSCKMTFWTPSEYTRHLVKINDSYACFRTPALPNDQPLDLSLKDEKKTSRVGITGKEMPATTMTQELDMVYESYEDFVKKRIKEREDLIGLARCQELLKETKKNHEKKHIEVIEIHDEDEKEEDKKKEEPSPSPYVKVKPIESMTMNVPVPKPIKPLPSLISFAKPKPLPPTKVPPPYKLIKIAIPERHKFNWRKRLDYQKMASATTTTSMAIGPDTVLERIDQRKAKDQPNEISNRSTKELRLVRPWEDNGKNDRDCRKKKILRAMSDSIKSSLPRASD